MSTLEVHLNNIALNISNPVHPVCWDDFTRVKEHVLHIMRLQDSDFRQICHKDILFGSMAHGIKACIHLVEDRQLPEYAHLDFSAAYYDKRILDRLANNNRRFLNRACLQNWLQNVFVNALDKYGNTVNGALGKYTLGYKWRGIAHTIEAVSELRSFCIDFVPAVKIDLSPETLHALPKGTSGPDNTNCFTFIMSNEQAELQNMARFGENVRDALRLLQAFRKCQCCAAIALSPWTFGCPGVGVSPLSPKCLSLRSSSRCCLICVMHSRRIGNRE
ncbi:uncharacterized protein LOC6561341 isoform X2 [Drosophila grimshawi]|uniref:uncharacterized protein LOC6561341 isoform X2 n=1 Tax=Drosophila grimshawi TaxID=7222 RepID=UPI001C9346F0|nr:uncharacterized protein LOC6561341 isoform X2 [Drosophila grimshawi]